MWTWLQQFWQDISYGLRALRSAPAFTLGATVVLALGVGVNLAEFQIFDKLIFHRLNFRDADSLHELSRASKQGQRLGFPPAAVEFYREQSSSFEWLVSEDTSLEVTVDADTGHFGFAGYHRLCSHHIGGPHRRGELFNHGTRGAATDDSR